MEKFENSFKIEGMTLAEALNLGDKTYLASFVYDPIGLQNSESYWFCCGVLDALVNHGHIKKYVVLKDAPQDQQLDYSDKVH